MIFFLKLLLAPALLALSTLAGRRWGPAVSGWLIGFPFISAPVSLILFIEQGSDFAARAAVGTLTGQVCVCVFSVVYILAAYRLAGWQCLLLALGAYFGCVAGVTRFPLPLFAAAGLLAGLALVLPRVLPRLAARQAPAARPGWDLPARMVTALIFVIGLSSAAVLLGPQLSGLLSAFPILSTILAGFTHAQQGRGAAQALLRGGIIGSFGILGFYLVLGAGLSLSGSLFVYLLAAAASVAANGLALRYAHLAEKNR